MSETHSTQYLEIYSKHRDRMKYTYPASFEVPVFSQSSRNVLDAVDPILKGTIYYMWDGVPNGAVNFGFLRPGSTKFYSHH